MTVSFGLGSAGAADLPPELSREKIVAYMKVGAGAIDWYGTEPEYEQTYRLITENGDATLPILEGLLRSADDWEFAQQATDLISALRLSNRQEKLRILKGVATGEIPVEDPINRIKTSILHNLSQWGEPDDVAWVLPFIDSEYDETVAAAVIAIGEIGNAEGGEAMMRALRERQARLSPEQRGGDLMLQMGDTAVAKIASRTAAKTDTASVPNAENQEVAAPATTTRSDPVSGTLTDKAVKVPPPQESRGAGYRLIAAVGSAIVLLGVFVLWFRLRRRS